MMTPTQLDALMGPRAGRRTPGGCDHCPSYQTVERIADGIWQATVHHHPQCPWLTAATANRAARRAARRSQR